MKAPPGGGGRKRRLPMLTEVVPPPGDDAPVDEASAEATHDEPAAAVDAALVQRVLEAVQDQVDRMLDVRLREALAPLLAAWSDALVRDLHEQLVPMLHDVVAKAVALELARRRDEAGG